MESEDLSVFMAAIYQAVRFIRERRRAAGPVGLALVIVALFATSTAAEPTWVLWEESNEMRVSARTPLNRVHATYASAEECVKAIDTEWQKTAAARAKPDGGSYRLDPTSAIMMMRYGSTTQVVTYTCLPDSTYPPF